MSHSHFSGDDLERMCLGTIQLDELARMTGHILNCEECPGRLGQALTSESRWGLEKQPAGTPTRQVGSLSRSIRDSSEYGQRVVAVHLKWGIRTVRVPGWRAGQLGRTRHGRPAQGRRTLDSGRNGYLLCCWIWLMAATVSLISSIRRPYSDESGGLSNLIPRGVI